MDFHLELCTVHWMFFCYIYSVSWTMMDEFHPQRLGSSVASAHLHLKVKPTNCAFIVSSDGWVFNFYVSKRPSDILGSHVSVYSLRFASCGEATSGKGAHGGSFFQEWGAQLPNLIPAWVVMWCTIYWGVKDLWAKLLPWQVIIQQGNPGTTFYILFEGEVAVSIAPRWCFFFVQLVKQRGLKISW